MSNTRQNYLFIVNEIIKYIQLTEKKKNKKRRKVFQQILDNEINNENK